MFYMQQCDVLGFWDLSQNFAVPIGSSLCEKQNSTHVSVLFATAVPHCRLSDLDYYYFTHIIYSHIDGSFDNLEDAPDPSVDRGERHDIPAKCFFCISECAE
jgi:hypothetical protein